MSTQCPDPASESLSSNLGTEGGVSRYLLAATLPRDARDGYVLADICTLLLFHRLAARRPPHIEEGLSAVDAWTRSSDNALCGIEGRKEGG